MKKEIMIGTSCYGKIILEIELKNIDSNSPSPTIDWNTMLKVDRETAYKLSISGHGRGMWGQIQDQLKDIEFYEQLVDDYTLNELLEIWEKYHLNDSKPGTKLQLEFLEFAKSCPHLKWDNLNHYDFCKHILRQHQLDPDCETNPQRPYNYGSLWLYQPIPEDVRQFLTNLKSDSKSTTRSDILDWIIMEGIKFHIIPTNSNPDMMGNTDQMDHWICEFWRPNNPKKIFKCHFSRGYGHRIGDSRMTNQELGRELNKWRRETYAKFGIKYPFFNPNDKISLPELGFDCIIPTMIFSHMNSQSYAVPPMPDEVLNCIAQEIRGIDDYNDWADWATEFGYDLNDKKQRRQANKAFMAIQEHEEQFIRVFYDFPYQFVE